MSIDPCTLKIRILTLVINTADLINERTTVTLSISHALLAPVAIFTTFIFIGILVMGVICNKFASRFLQSYAVIGCASVHISLSILVTHDLRSSIVLDRHVGLVLNAVLPMLITMLLLSDLVIIILSHHEEMSLPVPPSSREVSVIGEPNST